LLGFNRAIKKDRPRATGRKEGCETMNDANLLNQANNTVVMLRQLYQRGAYRVIRDPDGVITLWAIEGLERDPFSIQFANRGRISYNIGDMPPEFVRSFIDYVKKTVKR